MKNTLYVIFGLLWNKKIHDIMNMINYYKFSSHDFVHVDCRRSDFTSVMKYKISIGNIIYSWYFTKGFFLYSHKFKTNGE